MDIYLRFAVGLIALFLLTRWLSRKLDPAFGYLPLTIALLIKLLTGIAYGYIYLHYYGGDDTWVLNREGLIEQQILLQQPELFLEDLNIVRLIRENGWPDGLATFRQKFELALITKPFALFNFFSKGNYYINLLAFTAMSFFGQFFFFQVLRKTWPDSSNLFFWIVFGFAPVVFWLSGIRGDGWNFFFFGGCLWTFNNWLQSGRRKQLFLFLLCWSGLLMTRLPFALILLPSLMAWWLVKRRGFAVANTFAIANGIAVLLFFATPALGNKLNMPAAMVEKQADYFKLPGKTRIALDSLQAHPLSFIRIAPQAMANVWLHPSPAEASGILQWAMLIQNIFIICLFLTALLLKIPGERQLKANPLAYLLLFFSLAACLSMGYTVPFPGALIRYRAIPELCLLVLSGLMAEAGRLSYYKIFNVYKIPTI